MGMGIFLDEIPVIGPAGVACLTPINNSFLGLRRQDARPHRKDAFQKR
jgi:hypothetical protein